jgi:hypothetical protein
MRTEIKQIMNGLSPTGQFSVISYLNMKNVKTAQRSEKGLYTVPNIIGVLDMSFVYFIHKSVAK